MRAKIGLLLVGAVLGVAIGGVPAWYVQGGKVEEVSGELAKYKELAKSCDEREAAHKLDLQKAEGNVEGYKRWLSKMGCDVEVKSGGSGVTYECNVAKVREWLSSQGEQGQPAAP